MRRTDLEKQLRAIAKTKAVAFSKSREGANHTIFNMNGTKIPVPRHREISEHLAKKILKDARAAVDNT